ncbi:hypothetical protein AZF37_03925 [endosymbiont 'TC1' of Trimyema compressum]|nr:hypothetical protein AZF37_03925 [endosymbiont 'TC1' of Trimyema compressum]
MGIINKLYTLITLPIFGLLQGIQPVVGYNYGAHNYKRVKESVYKGALSCVLLSITSLIIILVFMDPILSLFTSDGLVKDITKYGYILCLVHCQLLVFRW